MGPDNFQQNILLEDIALAEEGLGNLDEARKLHLKAMELRKAEFADSFYIQRGRVYLARLDLAQGRSADALNKLQLLGNSAPADSKGLDEILHGRPTRRTSTLTSASSQRSYRGIRARKIGFRPISGACWACASSVLA